MTEKIPDKIGEANETIDGTLNDLVDNANRIRDDVMDRIGDMALLEEDSQTSSNTTSYSFATFAFTAAAFSLVMARRKCGKNDEDFMRA